MESNAKLYEQDLARWGTQTAAWLREGKLGAVDRAAVAEALESVGRDDAHRLWQHLRQLLVWFLAWHDAPPQRLQHPHWYVRIGDYRIKIGVIVTTSPSLKPTLAEDLADAYAYGREVAAEETGLPLEACPDTCPWTATQVIDDGFWPMGAQELDTTPRGVDQDETEADAC